jgi:hypothetical protein
MVQELIILLIFVAATAYIGRLLFRAFTAKGDSCASGCGGCSSIDFKKIARDLEKKAAAAKP